MHIHRFYKVFRFMLWAVFFLPALIYPSQSTLAQSPANSDSVVTALASAATVRVVIALQSPRVGIYLDDQKQAIKQTQNTVLDSLPAEDFQLIYQYETVPGLVAEISPQGLDALLAQPEVSAISLDQPVQVALTDNISLIGANTVWTELGFTGAGVNVAVIDTGIEATHPDLADNLVAQKCFNQTGCPPDKTGESDTARDENGHGTHIAGIISGRGDASPPGVAPDAGLVAVRVLSANGSGFISDVIAGMDWVVAHQADLNVSIINMSLGVGLYQNTCDDTDANTHLLAEAARAAEQAGIIIFAASGNQGAAGSIIAPACISSVVAVGNTYSTTFENFRFGSICTDVQPQIDQVACSSNSNPALDLLAPGVNISAASLGGGERTLSGTSMSTAHASGVAALMLQANPNLTAQEIETILKETGVPVVDARNGRSTSRIDALAAVARVNGNQITTTSGRVRLQGRTDYSGADIFLSPDACSIAVPDTPAATTAADGVFEITLPASQVYQCLQVVRFGYLTGQFDLPEGDLGTITLPTGDVTGDNLIDIFDISFVASHYDTADAASDLNVDGLVDIFDLILVAGNYNQNGPVTLWN